MFSIWDLGRWVVVNGEWQSQGSLVSRLHPSQRDWCLVSSLNSSVSFFHLRISLPSFTPKGKTYLKPGHINSEGRLMELASSCQTWTDFWLMTNQSAEGWGGGYGPANVVRGIPPFLEGARSVVLRGRGGITSDLRVTSPGQPMALSRRQEAGGRALSCCWRERSPEGAEAPAEPSSCLVLAFPGSTMGSEMRMGGPQPHPSGGVQQGGVGYRSPLTLQTKPAHLVKGKWFCLEHIWVTFSWLR